MKKIWLVEHPTSQYKEDVAKLAIANGLNVIDAKFADSFTKEQLADKPPKLTKLSEPKKGKE